MREELELEEMWRQFGVYGWAFPRQLDTIETRPSYECSSHHFGCTYIEEAFCLPALKLWGVTSVYIPSSPVTFPNWFIN